MTYKDIYKKVTLSKFSIKKGNRLRLFIRYFEKKGENGSGTK